MKAGRTRCIEVRFRVQLPKVVEATLRFRQGCLIQRRDDGLILFPIRAFEAERD